MRQSRTGKTKQVEQTIAPSDGIDTADRAKVGRQTSTYSHYLIQPYSISSHRPSLLNINSKISSLSLGQAPIWQHVTRSVSATPRSCPFWTRVGTLLLSCPRSICIRIRHSWAWHYGIWSRRWAGRVSLSSTSPGSIWSQWMNCCRCTARRDPR